MSGDGRKAAIAAAAAARRTQKTCARGHELSTITRGDARGVQRRCLTCRAEYFRRRKRGELALMKLERAEKARAEAIAELERLGISKTGMVWVEEKR